MCIGNQEVNCAVVLKKPILLFIVLGRIYTGVSNGFTLPNTFEFQAEVITLF